MRVRRFGNIVFALAGLLWLPVSVHCQLESILGLEFLRCAVEMSSSHNPDKDCTNCCAVEKSLYRAEQVRLNVRTAVLVPTAAAPALPVANPSPAELHLGILTAAPPELPQSWQFLLRTALPPRAPSLVS